MKKIFISVALLALPFFGAMAQSIVATNQIIDCGHSSARNVRLSAF